MVLPMISSFHYNVRLQILQAGNKSPVWVVKLFPESRFLPLKTYLTPPKRCGKAAPRYPGFRGTLQSRACQDLSPSRWYRFRVADKRSQPSVRAVARNQGCLQGKTGSWYRSESGPGFIVGSLVDRVQICTCPATMHAFVYRTDRQCARAGK